MIICNVSRDPFFYGRNEHESSPIYYVNDNIVEWSGLKPTRFEGVRGSGKSSTLKLLSWDVLWNVKSSEIVGSSKAKQFLRNPKHIGVYYKVEDLAVPLWDKWSVETDFSQRYFGTYLEFLYLYLLFDALNGIRKKTSTLFMDQEAEVNLTKRMLKICFPDSRKRPRLINPSYLAIRDSLSEIHNGIRHLMFNKASEKLMHETFDVVGPGSLIKNFANEFQREYPDLKDWNILILLDDCNFLTPWQTVVVNTMVANSAAPVSYKLSSLAGMYRTSDTLDEGRPLIADNIDIEPLPTKKNVYLTAKSKRKYGIRYPTFVNHILKARIGAFYGSDYAEKFDFRKYLGEFNLEQLLANKLRESENPEALSLLEEAKDKAVEQESPSITGTWLDRMKIRDPNKIGGLGEKFGKLHKRKISSQYTKKWKYVAGISLCKEFKIEFPYSSFHVILHLSSDSIREILRIMSMIWNSTGGEIDKFLARCPIDSRFQLQGVKNAASSHFDTIESKPLRQSGVSLQKICKRLGNLFSKCQSYPYILTTPETAALSINKSMINKDVNDIIRIAVVSGWMLKLEDEKQKKVFIGLHSILAPKFKINFRNAFYYPEPIPDEATLQAIFLGSDKEAELAETQILENRIKRYNTRHKKDISVRKRDNSIFPSKQGELFPRN